MTFPLSLAREELSSTDPAPNDDGIDWQHFHSFTNGIPELEQEVIQVFLHNATLDVAHLSCAFKAKQYEKWLKRVHKLYGSASNVGATKLAQYCDEGQSLSAEEYEEIQKLQPLILEEFARINRTMLHYRSRMKIPSEHAIRCTS